MENMLKPGSTKHSPRLEILWLSEDFASHTFVQLNAFIHTEAKPPQQDGDNSMRVLS
jgi:hypothetical protein